MVAVAALAFASDVSGSWSLRRGLFVEADPLAFVQRIEAARLHRTPVKEPFLSAIVTDEPESAIPDQPFNRAVRHVD